MPVRTFALALALAGLGGCAFIPVGDITWKRDGNVPLAAGRDFAGCTSAAVAGVPQLAALDIPSSVDNSGEYLALSGPPIDRLDGMIGSVRRVDSTIVVEFTNRPGQLPDTAERQATERLLADVVARVKAQCS